jgi:hypothetical protein
MEFEHRSVPVERILSEDTLFKISTGKTSEALVASIRLVGLLNPPILIACAGGFRIVSGFKRIAAMRQLNSNDIPARLLNPGAAAEYCIRIAIIENSSQRSLNLVEQANAVGLLATFHADSRLVRQPGNGGKIEEAGSHGRYLEKRCLGWNHCLAGGDPDPGYAGSVGY